MKNIRSVQWMIWKGLLLLTLLGTHDAYAGSAYKSDLKHATRGDKVYVVKDQLKAAIIWKATLLDQRMLEAQAIEQSRVYQLRDLEQEKILGELKARQDDRVLLFVSFYSSDRKFADLTDEKAAWRLTLNAGGREFTPEKIEKNGRTTPLDRLFYPYLDNWSEGYYVWFSGEAARYQRPWKLSVHGPQAHSTLGWK